MIKLENVVLPSPKQWEAIIRGMRNPMNSWDKSDSEIKYENIRHSGYIDIGPNDHELMTKLAKAGSDHGKYKRMIVVYVDITAPLYWWKEFDTYKVGTVANSCSTMHKIHEKEFTEEDFSMENLSERIGIELDFPDPDNEPLPFSACDIIKLTIDTLNVFRDLYNNATDSESKKVYWETMIQLLPSSYNQRRTVMFNYQVLANIYPSRKNHKLQEWRDLCEWIKTLPYSELITLEE